MSSPQRRARGQRGHVHHARREPRIHGARAPTSVRPRRSARAARSSRARSATRSATTPSPTSGRSPRHADVTSTGPSPRSKTRSRRRRSVAVAVGAVDGIATSLEDVRRQATARSSTSGRAGHSRHRRRPVRRPADEPVPVDPPPAVRPEHRVHPADDRLLRADLRAPEPQLRDRHPGRHRADPGVHRLRQPPAQHRRPAADRAGHRPVRARVHGGQPRAAVRRRPDLLRAGRIRAVHGPGLPDGSRTWPSQHRSSSSWRP